MDNQNLTPEIPEDLIRQIVQGDCIAFVGAGLSMTVGLPSWKGLLRELLVFAEEVEGKHAASTQIGQLIDSNELLAAAQTMKDSLQRDTVRRFITTRFQSEAPAPAEIHSEVCQIGFQAILTTNYDNLLEGAYSLVNSGRNPRVFTHRQPPELSGILRDKGFFVFKMHGSCTDSDSIILSHDEYRAALQNPAYRKALVNIFQNKTLLFVGYSLSDVDIRMTIDEILADYKGHSPLHYAIVSAATDSQFHNPAYRTYFQSQYAIKAITYVPSDYSHPEVLQILREIRELVDVERKRREGISSGGIPSLRGLPELQDEALIALFQKQYERIRDLFKHLHLLDVEARTLNLLDDVKDVKTRGIYSDKVRDFHQKLLLLLSSIRAWRHDERGAYAFYEEAKSLGEFTPQRTTQAAVLAANLSDSVELSRLFPSVPSDAEERPVLEVSLAWTRNDLMTAFALTPADCPNIDIALSRIRYEIRNLVKEECVPLLQRLDRTWEIAQPHPQAILEVSEQTDYLLRMLVREGWNVPEIDRYALLSTVKKRYAEAIHRVQPLKESFPELFAQCLVSAIRFHYFLNESEAAEGLQRNLVGMPDDLLVGRRRGIFGDEARDFEQLERLRSEGRLSATEFATMAANLYMQDDNAVQAEEVLRNGLAGTTDIQERELLLGPLVAILADRKDMDGAESLLQNSRPLSPDFAAVLRGIVTQRCIGLAEATDHLRSALSRYPRSFQILTNLVRILTPPASIGPYGDTLSEQAREHLVEALLYSERLHEILPAPEFRLTLARLLKRSGRVQEALDEVRGIGDEGYRARSQRVELGFLLQENGQASEAAKEFEEVARLYPEDYRLRNMSGAAWLEAGEVEKAIQTLEPLLVSGEADFQLFFNLGVAYRLNAAFRPDDASRSFDMFVRAFEINPHEPRLPGELIESGVSSGREREAWQLVSTIALEDNSNLRPVSHEAYVDVLQRQAERLQSGVSLYDIGFIPFTTFSRFLNVPAWLYWTQRIVAYKKDRDTVPFSHRTVIPTFTTSIDDLPPEAAGILMDQTALLTVATALSSNRPLLEAVKAANIRLFVPAGTQEWFKHQMFAVQNQQRPAYRLKFQEIKSAIQALPHATADSVPPDAYFVDEEPPEGGTDGRAIITSEFVNALVQAGILDQDAVPTVTDTQTDPPPAEGDRYVDLSRPLFLNINALVDWHESGLLSLWREEPAAWPSLIIDSQAHAILDAHVTEMESCQEALTSVRMAREWIRSCLEQGLLCEIPVEQVTTLPEQAVGQLQPSWQPALLNLETARQHSYILWTDDLCTLHLGADLPLPGHGGPAANAIQGLRQRYSGVHRWSTEAVLHWLGSSDTLDRDVCGRLSWQLFESGYRDAVPGDGLAWQLGRLPYEPSRPSRQYQWVLTYLQSLPEHIPPGIGEVRERFARLALIASTSDLITACWLAQEKSGNPGGASAFASALLQTFENRWPIVSGTGLDFEKRVLWGALARNFVWRISDVPRQHMAIKWLGQAACADERAPVRKDIARALEDGCLAAVASLGSNLSLEAGRQLIRRLLLPLLTTPLVNDFDPVLRRLCGYLLALEQGGLAINHHTVGIDGPEGTRIEDIPIPEQEIEEAAVERFREITKRNQDPPAYSIRGEISRDLGAGVLRLAYSQPIPCLLLRDERELQDSLVATLHGWLTLVDPGLADRIMELRRDLLSRNGSRRKRGIQQFCLAYLNSATFELHRDFGHSLRQFRNKNIDWIDTLCGIPNLDREADIQGQFEYLLSQREASARPSQAFVEFVLLCGFLRSPQHLESFAINHVNGEVSSPEDLGGTFSHLARLAEASTDLFSGLWEFFRLLLFSRQHGGVELGINGTDMTLLDWLRLFIERMVGFGLFSEQEEYDINEASGYEFVQVERCRRTNHGLLLRISMWLMGTSPSIAQQSAHLPAEDRPYPWLLRGLLLANRLQPVVFHTLGWEPDAVESHLRREIERLAVNIDADLYPDLFNPFLFGPDEFDHGLAMTLCVLMATWDISLSRETGKPFWWSDKLQIALQRLASRPLTDAELSYKRGMETSKPNRFGFPILEVPSDLARDILMRTQST